MLKDKTFLLKIFFALAVLESLAVLIALALIPADAKNAIVFGFSAARITLIAVVKVVLLTGIAALIWIKRAVDFTDNLLGSDKRGRAFAFASAFIAAAGILFLLTPAERIGAALYERVSPLVVLGTLIALQALALQFIWRGGKLHWEQLTRERRILIGSGVALAFFIAVWVFIAWSKVGIAPQSSGWLPAGTPILFQQVLFAWALGIAFLVFGKHLDQYKRADIIIALGVWLIAAAIWEMEPMRRWSYFNPKPTPPNFEYYPHSDAALYNTFSQNILVGAGRQFGLTIRPLYSIFLAWLHVIAGQKFEKVIMLQVFVLAIAPALVYLLASRLGGRAAGIVAATLVILREKNSIAATNFIEVSHSKLLMSDLPAMTLLTAFMLFLVIWFQDTKNRLYLGALAGGFLGAAILTRSQAQVMLPVAIAAIIIGKKDGWKYILQKSLVFILGVLVVVAPWVWRNYQVSGRAVIEYQEAYTQFFAGSYAAAAEEINMLPGESEKDYDSRMMRLIVNAVLTRPEEIIPKWFSYFIHNEVLSVTYLPLDLKFKDLYAYMDDTGFWSNPKDQLPARVLPLLFLTLCVIAVGIGTSYQRAGWLGVAPLIFHFEYSFTVTFIFASGWRFILPVDWIALLYFSIGLAQISLMLHSGFGNKTESQPVFNFEYTSIAWEKTALVLAFCMLFGISLPIFELSFPERYPELSSQSLIQKYIPNGFPLEEGHTLQPSELEDFLAAESNAIITHGRALYPAYYQQGGYWGDAPFLSESKQYDRLEFTLTGASRAAVYIPLATVPEYFPHASTVFIIGCKTPNAIRALAIKVNDEFVTATPWHGLTCNAK